MLWRGQPQRQIAREQQERQKPKDQQPTFSHWLSRFGRSRLLPRGTPQFQLQDAGQTVNHVRGKRLLPREKVIQVSAIDLGSRLEDWQQDSAGVNRTPQGATYGILLSRVVGHLITADQVGKFFGDELSH